MRFISKQNRHIRSSVSLLPTFRIGEPCRQSNLVQVILSVAVPGSEIPSTSLSGSELLIPAWIIRERWISPGRKTIVGVTWHLAKLNQPLPFLGPSVVSRGDQRLMVDPPVP